MTRNELIQARSKINQEFGIVQAKAEGTLIIDKMIQSIQANVNRMQGIAYRTADPDLRDYLDGVLADYKKQIAALNAAGSAFK